MILTSLTIQLTFKLTIAEILPIGGLRTRGLAITGGIGWTSMMLRKMKVKMLKLSMSHM